MDAIIGKKFTEMGFFILRSVTKLDRENYKTIFFSFPIQVLLEGVKLSIIV